MLRLVTANENAPTTARPQPPDSMTEPGIYSEPGVGDNILYTFMGSAGRPIGYLIIPECATGGTVTPEVQAMYDRCAAAMATRGSIRIG